jgi:hypothetical protein
MSFLCEQRNINVEYNHRTESFTDVVSTDDVDPSEMLTLIRGNHHFAYDVLVLIDIINSNQPLIPETRSPITIEEKAIIRQREPEVRKLRSLVNNPSVNTLKELERLDGVTPIRMFTMFSIAIANEAIDLLDRLMFHIRNRNDVGYALLLVNLDHTKLSPLVIQWISSTRDLSEWMAERSDNIDLLVAIWNRWRECRDQILINISIENDDDQLFYDFYERTHLLPPLSYVINRSEKLVSFVLDEGNYTVFDVVVFLQSDDAEGLPNSIGDLLAQKFPGVLIPKVS